MAYPGWLDDVVTLLNGALMSPVLSSRTVKVSLLLLGLMTFSEDLRTTSKADSSPVDQCPYARHEAKRMWPSL